MQRIPFYDEETAPYLAAAILSVCDRAALTPELETELLKQAVAIGEARVEIELTYPLPPDDAPFRAALARAVTDLRSDVYPHDRAGSLEERVHGNNMWNALRRFAMERVATVEG